MLQVVCRVKPMSPYASLHLHTAMCISHNMATTPPPQGPWARVQGLASSMHSGMVRPECTADNFHSLISLSIQTTSLRSSAYAAMDSFLKQAASQVTAAADKASTATQSKFGDSVAEQVLQYGQSGPLGCLT